MTSAWLRRTSLISIPHCRPPTLARGSVVVSRPEPNRCGGRLKPRMDRAPSPSRWPATLWIVRHGQSAGNVARDAAMSAGLDRIALDVRDVDVPLSQLGETQAAALGAWFAAMPEDERPEAVLTSPYLRARQTARAL